ncbi:MAG: hypothetical protein ACYDAG_16790 [Chloroflexota bacterium]
MLAEYIASNAGPGYMIQNGSVRSQFNLMWEATVIATAAGILTFSAANWTERRVLSRAHEH